MLKANQLKSAQSNINAERYGGTRDLGDVRSDYTPGTIILPPATLLYM